jgi:hypothetical protein
MMVSHEQDFREHLAGLASTERYIRFLNDVANTAGRPITPKSLRSDKDVEAFAAALAPHYAEKSIANYRSVMRRYVGMVHDRAL